MKSKLILLFIISFSTLCAQEKLATRTFKLAIVFFLLLTPCLRQELIAQTFTRVEVEAGLGIVRNNNGVSVVDYDQDGDLDLFFTGFKSFDPQDEGTWNRLMANNGDGTFSDVTMAAGFTNQFINLDVTASMGEKLGASWGDYDNDGYPDLFLANSRLDQLYHNEGDGSFTEVTLTAGVAGCHNCYSSSGLWFDHDRDGDLDLYVSILNGPNFLYRNNGDGSFTDVTAFEGVGGVGVTWSTLALDLGKDGFLDLYCANDTQINELFENRSGHRYNETSRAARMADEGAGMGMAIGDYNNDGLFDVYVTNIYNHQANPLFKNLGDRRFENVAETMGVENTGWGWGTHFFDFDHDGDEDLAAVNGVVSKQYINGQEQVDVQNYFFKNMLIESSIPGFIDWSATSNTDEWERARGLEVFDYDSDGDLDMIVANVESTPYLFRNETIGTTSVDTDQNWLQIKLKGTTTNQNAFGTEVKITIDGQSLYRWHQGGAFYGQSIKPVHFGVGAAKTIDEIQVTWLSGMVEEYYNVSSNQLIEIIEGGSLTNTKEVFAENSAFKLISNFPNPFVSQTQLYFEIQESGSFDIQILSASGQVVNRQHFKNPGIGPLEVFWDGKNEAGADLAAGMYYYVAQFANHSLNGKLIKID